MEYKSLDFYPTRNYDMIDRFIKTEDFTHGGCWEPCCGDGDIVKILKTHNDNVFYSDIKDYGYENTNIIDFFNCDFNTIPSNIINIITNPPYTQKRDSRFTIKALEFVKERNGKLAVLMKTSFRHSKGRYNNIFKDLPYTRVYDLIDRVSIYINGIELSGSGTTDYSWFVWDFTSGKLENSSGIKWL